MARQVITPAGLPDGLEQLRIWQSRRLQLTYQDFLLDSRYGPACRFFLEEVYAPRDFSQRDHDFERLYQLMLRFVPEQMLTLVREAIELNRLSNQLDLKLLDAFKELGGEQLEITEERYAKAYRICGNYPERLDQINRLVAVLEAVARGARNPLVLVALKVARQPAALAGWGDLHEFLVNGCLAFRQMKNGSRLIKAIRQRETLILNRIWAGDPLWAE